METLCEICHEAKATVHLCEVRHVAGKKPHEQHTTTHEFCEACFRKQDSSRGVELPVVTGDERCYHCAGPAESGMPNTGPAWRVRQQKFHWACHRCFRIESAFLLEEFAKMDPGLSEAEADKATEDVIRRADAYVQRMIASGSD